MLAGLCLTKIYGDTGCSRRTCSSLVHSDRRSSSPDGVPSDANAGGQDAFGNTGLQQQYEQDDLYA